MTRSLLIGAVLVVQVLCAVFFLLNILSSLTGFAPLAWRYIELIELGAGLGLLIGIVLGALILRRTLQRNSHVEGQLRAASGAFMDLLEENFDSWGLTPAERDVALFSIKGLSTHDIAAMRNTSEGTVKAQTNAIYRKEGVSGRPQLLSLFIEELMSGELTPSAAPANTMQKAAE